MRPKVIEEEALRGKLYRNGDMECWSNGVNGNFQHSIALSLRSSARHPGHAQSRHSLDGGFQAGRIGDAKHLGVLIDSLHKPAQSSAGAKFDKPSKALGQQ